MYLVEEVPRGLTAGGQISPKIVQLRKRTQTNVRWIRAVLLFEFARVRRERPIG